MSSPLQPQTAPARTPLAVYQHALESGKLSPDAAQERIVGTLETLYEAVSAPARKGLLSRFFSPSSAQSPHGLYLWGAVGRGKSMLMDMFYGSLTLRCKERIHFHAFMQEVHFASHKLRQEIEAKQLKIELLTGIAKDIAGRTRVLCLDELQVTDVADAMILSKLFTTLLAEGVIVVITSNRPPEELYLGGLQRETFLEFVHLIRAKLDVIELASPQDYRMRQIKAMQTVYISPATPQANAELDGMLALLSHHSALAPAVIEVQGHVLNVPLTYGGIACFHFADLCEKPLGAADYLAIAQRFHIVFVKNIPKLGPEKRNESRRFVTLIDTLYDHRVKLICTAEAAPEALYPHGDGAFEFRRLVSRLAEMQSQQYLILPHSPEPTLS